MSTAKIYATYYKTIGLSFNDAYVAIFGKEVPAFRDTQMMIRKQLREGNQVQM